MKKLLIALLLQFSLATIFAQISETDKQKADAFDLTAGGTFGKSKIPKSMTKLGIAQISIDFKQVSTRSVTQREKKASLFGKQYGKAATATVSAYLETTDGELTDGDYQQIANHFYNILQIKLKERGIDTVAWSAIQATDFYTSYANEQTDAVDAEKQGRNTWVSYNSNNGNIMYKDAGRFNMFSTKANKVAKMCEAIGAPVAFLKLQVDFSEIDVEVSVKSNQGYQSTWTPTTQSTTTIMKSKTAVAAAMKVTADENMASLMFDDNKRVESLTQKTPIYAATDYATSLEEDESKAAKKKNKFFSVSLSKKLESTPVVINTTKGKYIAAAKKALENYADFFVSKLIVLKD